MRDEDAAIEAEHGFKFLSTESVPLRLSATDRRFLVQDTRQPPNFDEPAQPLGDELGDSDAS